MFPSRQVKVLSLSSFGDVRGTLVVINVVSVDVVDDFVVDIVGSVVVVAKTSLTSKLKLGTLMLTRPFTFTRPSVVIVAAAIVGVVVVAVASFSSKLKLGISTPTKSLIFIGLVI